jgi:hypothetical protein
VAEASTSGRRAGQQATCGDGPSLSLDRIDLPNSRRWTAQETQPRGYRWLFEKGKCLRGVPIRLPVLVWLASRAKLWNSWFATHGSRILQRGEKRCTPPTAGRRTSKLVRGVSAAEFGGSDSWIPAPASLVSATWQLAARLMSRRIRERRAKLQ